MARHLPASAAGRSAATIEHVARVIRWNRREAHPAAQGPDPAPGSDASATPAPAILANGVIANRDELDTRLRCVETAAGLIGALYTTEDDAPAARIYGSCSWIAGLTDQRRLDLVRDRTGCTPLYYWASADEVLAATDLDQLLAALPRRPQLDPCALACHLHGHPPPSGRTYYRDVHSVPPGCVVSFEGERVRTTRYWEVPAAEQLHLGTDEAYADRLRELLWTVAAGYAPPRPAAITLSAGLDSTSVAAALVRGGGCRNLTACTWTARELPQADESGPAAATARALGLAQLTVPADGHWPLSAAALPGASPAFPAVGYYSEVWEQTFRTLAAAGIADLFTGFPGDMLFGGNVYSYPDLLVSGRWRQLASELRDHLPVSELGAAAVVRTMIAGPVLRALVPRWPDGRYVAHAWATERTRERFSAAARAETLPRAMLPGRRQRLALLRDPVIPWMSERIGAHAAAHGIALHHVLADHRLMEFAAALPTTQTFRGATRKIIVRNAMRGILPDTVLGRTTKIYPEAIARRGLKDRSRTAIMALLTHMTASDLGLVDEAKLRDEYERYVAGATDNASFWHAVTLEDWLRRFH